MRELREIANDLIYKAEHEEQPEIEIKVVDGGKEYKLKKSVNYKDEKYEDVVHEVTKLKGFVSDQYCQFFVKVDLDNGSTCEVHFRMEGTEIKYYTGGVSVLETKTYS